MTLKQRLNPGQKLNEIDFLRFGIGHHCGRFEFWRGTNWEFAQPAQIRIAPNPRSKSTELATDHLYAHSRCSLSLLRSMLRHLVFNDLSTFHHEFDTLKLGNVRQRIARYRDQIGVLTLVD